jgi:hypothetical protein
MFESVSSVKGPFDAWEKGVPEALSVSIGGCSWPPVVLPRIYIHDMRESTSRKPIELREVSRLSQGKGEFDLARDKIGEQCCPHTDDVVYSMDRALIAEGGYLVS